MKSTIYSEVREEGLAYWRLMGFLGLLVGLGALSFFHMEHHGHWVTGMDNQIVWGAPHVFAVFLIVAASGALNIASISSVFSRKRYKPLARMSAVLAITLLAGGLAVLVLDLGRPERLIVAMTEYNFRSIFAWNIYLYTGFFVVVLAYLWTMMDPPMHRYNRVAGTTAFLWRLILTTGTGSIFGFLVARQGYDAAILAPMFIIMSFAFGKAVFLLLLIGIFRATKRELSRNLVDRLKYLMGIFIAAVLYFNLAYHLTNLYAAEHHGIERFILLDGGIFTALFWIVQVSIGAILPLILIYSPRFRQRIQATVVASILVIVGGIAQLYVLIIGGQAFPLVLFPGKEVTSTFNDGVVNHYLPGFAEIFLGLGGVALALLLFLLAIRLIPLVPSRLDDEQEPPIDL